MVATYHHKWPYENLDEKIFFAFNIREGRKALAKRSLIRANADDHGEVESATTGFYGLNYL